MEESYISLTGYYSSDEAEAAFRSNDKPCVYVAYIDPITANMDKMGGCCARDTYINDPSVSVGEASLTPVTWDDARRYDYGYQGFQLLLL